MVPGALSTDDVLVSGAGRDAKMVAFGWCADDTQRIGLKCVIMSSDRAVLCQAWSAVLTKVKVTQGCRRVNRFYRAG